MLLGGGGCSWSFISFLFWSKVLACFRFGMIALILVSSEHYVYVLDH